MLRHPSRQRGGLHLRELRHLPVWQDGRAAAGNVDQDKDRKGDKVDLCRAAVQHRRNGAVLGGEEAMAARDRFGRAAGARGERDQRQITRIWQGQIKRGAQLCDGPHMRQAPQRWQGKAEQPVCARAGKGRDPRHPHRMAQARQTHRRLWQDHGCAQRPQRRKAGVKVGVHAHRKQHAVAFADAAGVPRPRQSLRAGLQLRKADPPP